MVELNGDKQTLQVRSNDSRITVTIFQEVLNIINDTQSVELEKSALFFEGDVAQNIKTGNNPLDMFRNNKSELHEKVGKIIGFDTSPFSLHVFNSEGGC